MTVHTHDPAERTGLAAEGEKVTCVTFVFSQKLFLSLLGYLLKYLHTAGKNLLSEPG